MEPSIIRPKMQSTPNATLYIRTAAKHFDFVSFDRTLPQPVAHARFQLNPDISVKANLHQALQQEEMTLRDYARVTVVAEAPSTLVPLDYFDEQRCEALFNFNFTQGAVPMKVLCDMLPQQSAVVVYGLDKALHHTLCETFEGIRFICSTTPLLRHYAACSPHTLEIGRLFLCVEAHRLTVAAFRSGRLEMCNTYSLHAEGDALYFALYAAKVWDLKESDEVYLAGTPQQAEQLMADMTDYVRHMQLMRPQDEFPQLAGHLPQDLPYDMAVLMHQG